MRNARHRRFVPDRFGRLLDALRPTRQELARAHEAAAEAARQVRSLIRPVLASPAMDSLIVGALGLDCAVRPVKTVELLYVLPAHMRKGGPVAPAALLDGMCHLLGPTAGRIENGVALPAKETTCWVRPGFALTEGRFALPDEAGGGWCTVEPLAEAVALRLAGSRIRDLVRLVEAWRRHNAVPVAEDTLRTAALHVARYGVAGRGLDLSWDALCIEVFAMLAARADPAWVFHAKRAEAAALAACRAVEQRRYTVAAGAWRSVFGPAVASPGPVWRLAGRLSRVASQPMPLPAEAATVLPLRATASHS